MSDQEFDFAGFAAEQTGAAGVDADAVSDQLAGDIEDYAEHAEIRDAHLAEDADQDDQQLGDQDQQPTGKSPRGHVPIGALQQERAQRQQLQAELEAHRQQLAQFQQLRAYLEQQQQAAQQQAIPNFEDDPQGHLEARLAQQQQQLAHVQQAMHQQQFSQQLQSEVNSVAQTITTSEAEFANEVGAENYAAAFEHVRQHVQGELAQRFPGISPQQLAVVETAAGIQFAKQCQAQGIDPARHIFERAQALGFTPSGQRVPRRAPPTSLSNIPAAGRAPDQRGKLTAKDIASMPQEDFDKLFESMRDTQRPQF
jgi:hypothetical protein